MGSQYQDNYDDNMKIIETESAMDFDEIYNDKPRSPSSIKLGLKKSNTGRQSDNVSLKSFRKSDVHNSNSIVANLFDMKADKRQQK